MIIMAAASVGLFAIILFSDPVNHDKSTLGRPCPPAGKGCEGPQVSYLEAPRLPSHLGYWGIQAEAVMEFTVGKTGKASRIRMVRTTHMEIVHSCKEAVRRATFLPARNRQGEAVESRMILPICPVPPASLRDKKSPAPSQLANVG